MKKHRSSTDLFFPQVHPTISFQKLAVKSVKRKKTNHFLSHYRKTVEQCLAILGIGTLFLCATYLFFIQLAEYGW